MDSREDTTGRILATQHDGLVIVLTTVQTPEVLLRIHYTGSGHGIPEGRGAGRIYYAIGTVPKKHNHT